MEACLHDAEQVRSLCMLSLQRSWQTDRWLWPGLLALVALTMTAFWAGAHFGASVSWALASGVAALAVTERALRGLRSEAALLDALQGVEPLVAELQRLLRSDEHIGCEELERLHAQLEALSRHEWLDGAATALPSAATLKTS
jgi:hypothetical protein